ncbi:MAG TPA: MarR family transcriptional regulator [Cyclobacteriaceae bacterium]|nr:MarR family transcriptional regulator [Cyclobacteriaceae bacterium]
MTIEDAISQKNFRNEYQKVSLNLVYTANFLSDLQRKFFSGYNITVTQYNVLRILKGQGAEALTTAEIRCRMLDKSSDASRIVDRLAARGLVRKKICPGDKRLVDVSISEKGTRLLEEIEKNIAELDELMSKISVPEAMELNRLLDKVRN